MTEFWPFPFQLAESVGLLFPLRPFGHLRGIVASPFLPWLVTLVSKTCSSHDTKNSSSLPPATHGQLGQHWDIAHACMRMHAHAYRLTITTYTYMHCAVVLLPPRPVPPPHPHTHRGGGGQGAGTYIGENPRENSLGKRWGWKCSA